jgi:hypothetical protein
MVRQRWGRIALLVGVLLVLCGILVVPVHIPLIETFRTPVTTTIPSTPLVQGVEIVQQFPATGAPIAAIEIQFATYKRINVGTVKLIVQAQRGGKWQQLAERTIAKDRLRDNAFESFEFSPPIMVDTGELLAIAVTADRDDSQAISWWIDPTLSRTNYQLLVNGAPQPGMAVFAVDYAQKSGPLIALLPDFWERLTVFLDPLWQAFLMLGLALVILPPLWMAIKVFKVGR